MEEPLDSYPGIEEADICACVAYGAEMSREPTCRSARRCEAPRRFRRIAVIRLSPRPTASELAEAALSLSQALADRAIDGRLWVVQRGAVREYLPDDES